MSIAHCHLDTKLPKLLLDASCLRLQLFVVDRYLTAFVVEEIECRECPLLIPLVGHLDGVFLYSFDLHRFLDVLCTLYIGLHKIRPHDIEFRRLSVLFDKIIFRLLVICIPFLFFILIFRLLGNPYFGLCCHLIAHLGTTDNKERDDRRDIGLESDEETNQKERTEDGKADCGSCKHDKGETRHKSDCSGKFIAVYRKILHGGGHMRHAEEGNETEGKSCRPLYGKMFGGCKPVQKAGDNEEP